VFDTEAPPDELPPPLDGAVVSVDPLDGAVVSLEDELLHAAAVNDTATSATPIAKSRARFMRCTFLCQQYGPEL